ncbi:MAG: oxidoreductase [Oscillospiraceae bacterium]|nr:oxidoreductase [Oscillospiraceae bacterium]
MEKLHVIVDLAKCVGCFNCMIACKDEHVGNNWYPYTAAQQKHDQKWIEPEKHERGAAPFTEICFVTKLCQHCNNAPCEKASDAITRRADGVVLIDAEKAKGDRALPKACPYGKISWNEDAQTAQKCTMCAHLLDDGWKEPRCVQACPLRALSVVFCSDDEFAKMAKAQDLMSLTDGSNDPRVLYRNLHRLNTCFIAGALAFQDEDIQRAAADAEVQLLQNGEIVAQLKTDFFGEFKIDRIAPNSGTYELICSLDGYEPIATSVTVADESPCLDVMLF